MGGSIQRSIYKDLNRLLQGNTFLNGTLLRMPKHIKMNIDIDTYEIDLNSEKPTPNQFEMNKLEGNQKSGKSIFDVKLNESGKPENDGLVEVEVPKAKPSSKGNSPTKRNKRMRGKQWKN
jgi:hypothetical protein